MKALSKVFIGYQKNGQKYLSVRESCLLKYWRIYFLLNACFLYKLLDMEKEPKFLLGTRDDHLMLINIGGHADFPFRHPLPWKPTELTST